MIKTDICCEFNTDNVFLFSDAEIENISAQLLEYAISQVPEYSIDNIYQFDILITDNSFIQNINNEYRNKNIPTDVITFALFADSENKFILDDNIQLGQIIISAQKVLQQAEENQISKERELLNLLSHGILHLLGVDHPDDNSLEKMLELQNKMIESVKNVQV